jgi:hypothetical protein
MWLQPWFRILRHTFIIHDHEEQHALSVNGNTGFAKQNQLSLPGPETFTVDR